MELSSGWIIKFLQEHPEHFSGNSVIIKVD